MGCLLVVKRVGFLYAYLCLGDPFPRMATCSWTCRSFRCLPWFRNSFPRMLTCNWTSRPLRYLPWFGNPFPRGAYLSQNKLDFLNAYPNLGTYFSRCLQVGHLDAYLGLETHFLGCLLKAEQVRHFASLLPFKLTLWELSHIIDMFL